MGKVGRRLTGLRHNHYRMDVMGGLEDYDGLRHNHFVS